MRNFSDYLLNEDEEFKNLLCFNFSEMSASPDFVNHQYESSPNTTNISTEKKKKRGKNVRKLSSSSSQQCVSKLRKLEGRARLVDITLIPKLRIVKRDIRRRFSEMYSNVMNAHDNDLLHRFLQEFCIPNCHFTINVPSQTRIPVRRGIWEIFFYTLLSQAKIPDGIQWLSDTTIHVALEKPGSRIVSTVSFRGTMLFDIIGEEEEAIPHQVKSYAAAAAASSSYSSSSCSSGHSPSSSSSSSHSSSEESKGFGESGILLPPIESLPLSPTVDPKEIILHGILTMSLDDVNRIEAFQLDASSVETRSIWTQ